MIKIHPPSAKKITTRLEKHGDVRLDDYYWLNDRENSEVLNYLHQEKAYYDALTAHTKTFQEDFLKR